MFCETSFEDFWNQQTCLADHQTREEKGDTADAMPVTMSSVRRYTVEAEVL